ncbi:extracellular solute-binding protein [Cohnella fermenti]|uniref:Extracellular solute-binding protein n=1 Tax=Cohnella fermenti TaxID=2565925 RepID=A0A4S4BSB9_9BACL|nr:extracellular solute-binding protein [Cohnella fermenti]THF77759.1 extracellular solute-binding protein [Cohnella fermenti]
MRKSKTAFSWLIAVLAVTLVVSGCSQGSNNSSSSPSSSATEASNEGDTSGRLTDKDVEFTIAMSENSLQPINADSPSLKVIYEKTGIKLKPVIIPGADYATKMNTLLVSGELPDFFLLWGEPMDIYDTGALLPMRELIKENAPELQKYYDTVENLDRTMIMDDIYTLPMIRADENYEKGTLPIIRTDLLEEQGLETPTTWDELYEVLLKLRDAYPDSIPYGARGDNRLLVDTLSPLRSLGAHYDLYPNADGNWELGRAQTSYKKALELYNKMYENKILDNEYLLVDTQAWLEGLSSGKYLFFYDNPVFIDRVTQPLKQIQPNAKFEPLPILANDEGERKNYKQPDHYFNRWGVNKRVSDPELAVKFLNWLYSEEGMLALNYGEEGVHYELDSAGQPQWKQEIVDKYSNVENPFYTIQSDIGIGELFFTPVWKSSAADQFKTTDEGSISPLYIHNMYKDDPAIISIPQLPPFTQEEGAELKEIRQAINDYSLVQLNKFVSGAKDLSEFEQFAKEIMDKGGSRMEQIANEAEKRFQESK